VGRKYFMSLAKRKTENEILEGKWYIIKGDFRVRRASGKVKPLSSCPSMHGGIGLSQKIIPQKVGGITQTCNNLYSSNCAWRGKH
jgi:hypothetical protein